MTGCADIALGRIAKVRFLRGRDRGMALSVALALALQGRGGFCFVTTKCHSNTNCVFDGCIRTWPFLPALG